MAEIRPQYTYTIKLTDRELRVIAKGLALVAGVKVSTTTLDKHTAVEIQQALDDERDAAALNKQLLEVRILALTSELKAAEGALARAEATR
jgi:hypothetical protein